jgi:1,4-dihydroxy-6-naphthoate synthase
VHRSKLEVAISPCPNDVFIFSGVLLQKVESFIDFEVHFYDIEELNRFAIKGSYPVIKASFAILSELSKTYQVLDTGSALGFGTGPVVVAKSLPYPQRPRVGLPGEHTTANLLFKAFFPEEYDEVFLPFYQIIPKLLEGKIDLGVLIHEGRFVYEGYGLKLVYDLGSLWEKKHKLPLPLGGIFVKKDLPSEFKQEILNSIKASLKFAKGNWCEVLPLLKKHAQELDEETIKRHVETFVNDYTESLGKEGVLAIKTLAQYQGLREDELKDLFWGTDNGSP